MALEERIRIVLETVTDKATSGIASFRTSVGEADGVMGKFRAGASSAFETVKANAGAFAAAAGTALIGFGIKAVEAFEGTAKSAVNLGKAVGLSTEEASRWIAVGDDMGISADKLQSAFGKVSKSLDSKKWEEYGIATRDAGGAIRPTNDILLDSFDVLARLPTEQARAKAGSDLFGKGYASLAPLVGKTRDEMEKYLGSVEKGQVITDREAAKAERMRLAQDQLQDAIHEVTLEVGQAVAGLAPYIEGLALVIAKAVELAALTKGNGEDFASNKEALEAIRPTIESLGLDYDRLFAEVAIGSKNMDDVRAAIRAAQLATQDHADRLGFYEQKVTSADGAVQDLIPDLEDEEKQHYLTEAAIRSSENATKALDDAIKALKGSLDIREAARNFEEALFTYRGATAPTEADTDALIGKMLTLIETLGNIPTEVKTQMIAALDQGNIDWVESRLAFIARDRVVSISGQLVGADLRNAMEGRGAAGVPTLPGKRYGVAENGPELYQEGDQTYLIAGAKSGRVVPLRPSDAPGGLTIVLNTGNIYSTADLHAELNRWGSIIASQIQQGRRS